MNHVKRVFKALLQILLLQYCSASDTITVNQPIKDGDTLVSEKGTFVLGFFSPGKSSNRYVGVWYKVSYDMVLWVANRDIPVNDTSGVLSVNPKGNLVLYSESQQVPIWSTNVSVSKTNNTIAQLLYSGNLVLIQQDNERVVWQSFDYPTHVLISGMKLGLDIRSGLNRYLTSWKSQDDPGNGNCTLEINTNGSPQLMLYKNAAKWWRSGHWNGIQWGGIPALGRSYLVFNITFKNNKNEISVNWTVLDPSILSFITVDGSGSIQQYSWQDQQQKWVGIYSAPSDPCDDYGKCGAFGNCDPYTLSGFECSCLPGYEPKTPHEWALRDYSNGCKRKEGPSMCKNGEGFVKVANVKIPDTSIVRLESSLTLEECRVECLMNCSCLAYSNADVRNGGSGCMTWYGNVMDTKQFTNGGQDLFVRVDSIHLEEYAKKSKGISTKWIYAIVGLSVAILFLLIASLLYWFRKQKRKGIGGHSSFFNYDATNSTRYDEDSPDRSGIDKTKDKSDVQFFDLSIIVKATNNFSSDNKLGQGGFGSVYKGSLDDGQEIAVKRLSVNSGQGVEEFKNEVMLIAKLQHRNLVRLLGCCVHKKEKMLIYEYMPNRSLDMFIFDMDKKTVLDWRKRFEIIFGIARGILYLHQDSRLKIIHRDLKASNVLLDATMNPKISDFGMARMFGDDQLEANTNRVVGTYGYMSPEYAMEGLYSIKSDVFSFGVLTLEIISGKKNIDYKESSSLNMIGQLWEVWQEGKALNMVDSSMNRLYSTNEVLRCIQIGLLCVQELATDRPTMLDVVFMLRNETHLPSPNRTAFVYKSSNSGADSSTSKGVSVNNMTVTMVEPR